MSENLNFPRPTAQPLVREFQRICRPCRWLTEAARCLGCRLRGRSSSNKEIRRMYFWVGIAWSQEKGSDKEQHVGTRCPHQMPDPQLVAVRDGGRRSQKYIRQIGFEAQAGREITSTSSRTPSEPQIFAHTYTLMSKRCKSGMRGSLGSIRAATMYHRGGDIARMGDAIAKNSAIKKKENPFLKRANGYIPRLKDF